MRAAEIILETIVGMIKSRFSHTETPVYRISNRTQLENLTKKSKYKTLRLMIEPEGLMAWDAEYATHRNAEEILGFNGPRLSIRFDPLEIEYNYHDITVKQIKSNPTLKKLFTAEELAAADYTENEV